MIDDLAETARQVRPMLCADHCFAVTRMDTPKRVPRLDLTR